MKTKDGKRCIGVDTLGPPLAVVVTITCVHDDNAAELLVVRLTTDQQPNLEVVWADE